MCCKITLYNYHAMKLSGFTLGNTKRPSLYTDYANCRMVIESAYLTEKSLHEKMPFQDYFKYRLLPAIESTQTPDIEKKWLQQVADELNKKYGI